MIDQQTVDKIFDAADIVDVVGDYVSLKRRGANYWGTCPFHDEKTPSFSVSPAKNIYKCFGCGKGGNAVNFIMGVENLSYYEALKFLAKKFHIEIKEKELTIEEKEQQNERESLMALNEWAHQQFVKNLETQEGQAVGMSYFEHRGFRADIIKKFQLGYALNQRDAYTKEALAAGYKLDYLEKTGLTIVKENYQIDRFYGRAIFPIHSISGRVIAFGGRAIKKDEVAKYQNSPESDVYHKSSVLYGLYFAKNAITRKKKCYIVEGYADVVSMVQAGVENIVAPCGTALTTQQIQQLRRILPSSDSERTEDKNVTLLYDGDGAGMHAALKNGKMLLEEGLNVKVVVLPEPEDPDSFAQNHESSEVLKFLEENEQDYISFKINHYWEEAQNDPMKMAQLVEDVASTIEVIPDEMKRSVYSKMASDRLGVSERMFLSRINAIYKKKVEEEKGPKLADAQSEVQNNPPIQGDVYNPQTKWLQSNLSSSYDKVEREVIRCLVLFGEQVIVVEGEEDTSDDNEETNNEGSVTNREEKSRMMEQTVAEYIKEDLCRDEIRFENRLYANMLNDYIERLKYGTVSAIDFFKKNMNPDYVAVALDLAEPPHQLSKMFDGSEGVQRKVKAKEIMTDEKKTQQPGGVKPFMKDVLYCLWNLKSAWMRKEIQERMELLKNASTLPPERVKTIMEEIINLKEIEKEVDKMLGERHVQP